ncbi:TetR/AcrR family transcriptional regulator [Nocardia sp. XZ_19_385]|uniref:TetR/AcrR family transcriptional regulator n=1 Tax=Nocardia sp. XZ_19_385 TaxID=2769488 RepID=UPI00188FADBA|nr:TetR family transcriptional regulator [Nocardia sp. XZ_19_385]
MTSTDPRNALLDAAERLIALRGIDVPLRDIATEAGQRNNSAVHYYFGSRTGLIDAVIERRMSVLETVRLDMLAQHEADGTGHDLHQLVDILVRPMIDIARTGHGTHYSRFLEVVRTQPAIADFTRLDAPGHRAVRIITTRLAAALPAPHSRHRIESMATAMFALLADQERRIEAHSDLPDATADIVAMLVGLATAPTPVATTSGGGAAATHFDS